jgi:putative transposase
MSRKGMPYDNAVIESFFSTLKNELVHHERFSDHDHAKACVFDYIEGVLQPAAPPPAPGRAHAD